MYLKGLKTCKSCGLNKPIIDFHPDRENWIGKLEKCLECENPPSVVKGNKLIKKPVSEASKRAQRNIRARSRGFSSAEEMDASWEASSKLCEICGNPPKEGQRLAADHDHKTGKFRGWLCYNCNCAIGMMKDDYRIAIKATVYLELHNSSPE